MKIKLSFLTAFCLLLFACPSSDDDNTLIILTTDNYLFEGKVTQSYYAETLSDLQTNDPNNIDGIQVAQDNVNAYQGYIDAVLAQAGIGVVPPPPPCPDIVADLCFPLTGFFVTPSDVTGSFRVLDDNGDELATINGQAQTLGNTNSQLKYYTYNLNNNINGPVTLEITRTDATETLIYTIDAYVRP